MRNHTFTQLKPLSSFIASRALAVGCLAALVLCVCEARAGSATQICTDPTCNQNTGGSGGNSQAAAAQFATEWNSPVRVASGPTSTAIDAATAVTVGVTPSTIDELYTDFIQISVNGLASGETVRVEKFQVNNNTGTIDAGAILQQSFLLTDGVSNKIGGIANINVPADTTAADGNIVANISFLDEAVPNTVGEYVFRVSSPTSAFSPMTARLTVTAVPDAQNISGTVTSGAPVPNAYVILLNTEGGGYDFYAATIADAAGNYSFGAEEGEYDLVAAKRGFVGAFGNGVEQSLAPGQNKTVNITMEAGTRTISGKVKDSKTGAGLPAVQVVFKSDDDKFTVDYTDASGNFNTSVTPGIWELEVERNAVNQIGYLTTNEFIEADTTSGNATGVDISLTRATALIYGLISDGSTGIPETEVDAADETGFLSAFTATDSNGNYVIAVGTGVWSVNATAGTLQETDDIAPAARRLFINDGQTVAVNFAAKHANARIQGTLQDNTGSPISDIGYRVVNKTTKHYTDFGTFDDGSFDAALFDGTWRITPVEDDIADTDLIFVIPGDITVAAGQTLSGINLEAVEPTRQVVVQVNDNQGSPFGGALLHITTQANGKTYVSYGYTGDDGQVSLPAFDGTWTLIGNGSELEGGGFREIVGQTVTINGSNPNVNIQLQLLPPTGNTLVNLSTRGTVETGENVLIGGFIVPGVAPKKVLVRAIGPSLGQAGVNGALSDPTLTLFDGTGTQIAFNDDWMNSADKQAIIDTTIPPTNNKESAIIATLAPGNYTAKVAGANNTTGVALVELYDLASFSSSTLANIATRGRVNQGENVLIAGYIVGGYKNERVVIRAIGPSLGQAGVNGALADPLLELHNGQGAIIASNNDWQDTQKQELIDTTIPPSNPKESAIVISLAPGNYTAVVSGVGGTTGVGLAEVYNVTSP